VICLNTRWTKWSTRNRNCPEKGKYWVLKNSPNQTKNFVFIKNDDDSWSTNVGKENVSVQKKVYRQLLRLRILPSRKLHQICWSIHKQNWENMVYAQDKYIRENGAIWNAKLWNSCNFQIIPLWSLPLQKIIMFLLAPCFI
jgi:hypothetical protein